MVASVEVGDLPGPDTPVSWLAGRPLVAIDGTVLALADTPGNDGFFGRPGSGRGGKPAFPRARMVALGECRTYAGRDPDQVSVGAALRIACRPTAKGDFPPSPS